MRKAVEVAGLPEITVVVEISSKGVIEVEEPAIENTALGVVVFPMDTAPQL